MDVVAELSTGAPPEAVYAVVADLSTYPQWLDIVRSVESLDDGDDGPAWSIVLQARIGPLRRSKRLRMVRCVDTATEVCFIRRELDGRSHSTWRLEASIEVPAAAGRGDSHLTMRLHYGGALWIPVLDRLLADEIERSRPRLIELLGR